MLMTPTEAQAWLDDQFSNQKVSDKSAAILAGSPDLNGRIQILWHSDYWDGPITGYVTLDGETGYWINRIEDFYNVRLDIENPGDDDSCQNCDCKDPCYTYDYLYAVYKLTPEQERIELANHALFRKHVGTHTEYGTEQKVDHNDPNDSSPIKLGPGVFPRDSWDLYYKAEKPSAPPVKDSQLVGWASTINPNGWTR